MEFKTCKGWNKVYIRIGEFEYEEENVRLNISPVTSLLNNLDLVLEAVEFSKEIEEYQISRKLIEFRKNILGFTDEDKERELTYKEALLSRMRNKLYNSIPLFKSISSELKEFCTLLYLNHVTKPLQIPDPYVHFIVHQFLYFLKNVGANGISHLISGADFALKSVLACIEIKDNHPEDKKLKKTIVYLTSKYGRKNAMVAYTNPVTQFKKFSVIQDNQRDEIKARRKLYNILCLTNRVVESTVQNLVNE